MKKQVFAVLLACILAASLAACSGVEEEPSGAGESLSSGAQEQTVTPAQTTADSGSDTAVAEKTEREETMRGNAATQPPSTKAPVKTTHAAEKATDPHTEKATAAQKTATFTFSQKFPIEVTCYGARVQILSAEISAVKMTENGCSFDFICSAKRLEDGLGGEKSCSVRIKWLDENGKQVKATTAGIGLLAEGETGRGNTAIGMKASELQSSPNHRFTVVLEGYGTAQ